MFREWTVFTISWNVTEVHTLKQEALYRSWTTCPMLVLEAWGNRGSNLCTTKRTNTFLDKAEPSSKARRTNFRASSCIARKSWAKSKFIMCKDKINSLIKRAILNNFYRYQLNRQHNDRQLRFLTLWGLFVLHFIYKRNKKSIHSRKMSIKMNKLLALREKLSALKNWCGITQAIVIK